MSRSKRTELQGAIHLVRVCGNPSAQVFFDPKLLATHSPRLQAIDEQHFESLMWESCEQYRCLVHAYEVEPNMALIALETLGAPLSWVMQATLGRYAQYLGKRVDLWKSRKPFPQRYRSQIVEPSKLPYVVRRIHTRPIEARLCRNRANYPFGSELIHSGRRLEAPKCIVVQPTQKALAALGYAGLAGYWQFMSLRDTPAIEDLLKRSVVGSEQFASAVKQLSARPWRVASRTELVNAVAAELRIPLNVIYGPTHHGAFARALVAWCAMRTGSGQLAEVARWFDVTGADLRYLIRHHRMTKAVYFERTSRELERRVSNSDSPTSGSPFRVQDLADSPRMPSAKGGPSRASVCFQPACLISNGVESQENEEVDR